MRRVREHCQPGGIVNAFAYAFLLISPLLAACLETPQIELPDVFLPPPDFATAPDLADVARPSCEQLLGGPELPPTSTEARADFAAELAALDLRGLPPQLDLTPSSDLTRATIGYLLGKSYFELGTILDRDAALKLLPLGRVVVGAFAAADPAGQKGADFLFLRRGLHRYYHCARGYPLTLDEFRRTVWDYRKASGQVVNSMPKAGPRRLYANPDLGIYVAETLINDMVRETEIQVTKARPDGAHDFLAYDEAGQQVRTSTFASSGGTMRVAASPYTCMACHYDRKSKSFTAIVPVN